MLGKYKMKKYTEPGSLICEVSEIHIHPDQMMDTADGDLAILVLPRQLLFTTFVRTQVYAFYAR